VPVLVTVLAVNADAVSGRLDRGELVLQRREADFLVLAVVVPPGLASHGLDRSPVRGGERLPGAVVDRGEQAAYRQRRGRSRGHAEVNRGIAERPLAGGRAAQVLRVLEDSTGAVRLNLEEFLSERRDRGDLRRHATLPDRARIEVHTPPVGHTHVHVADPHRRSTHDDVLDR